MSLQESFDIDLTIIIIFILHLFTVDKFSQKRGKTMYVYKSVNINCFITFKTLPEFQESSFTKVK